MSNSTLHYPATNPWRKSQKRLAGLLLALMLAGGFTRSSRAAGEFELGLKAADLGQYALAIRYLHQAIQQDPQNPNIHYYLANTLVKDQRFDEARTEYQQIISLAPDSQAGRLAQMGLANLRNYVAQGARLHFSSSSLHGQIETGHANHNGADHLSGLPPVTGPNYWTEVDNNGSYARWSVHTQPLKIFIEQSPAGIRNFQPAFVSLADKAITPWLRSLNDGMTTMRVNTADQADIRVRWTNAINTHGRGTEEGTAYTAGVTVPDIRNGQLHHMEMTLATFDINNLPQTPENIYAVAVHEFGHALGLLGHSSDPADVMFAENHGITKLSARDTNTIRMLYSQDVDITSAPPVSQSSQSANPQQALSKLNRLSSEVTRLETAAHQNGGHLDWLNLGSAYFQKGLLLEALTRQNPAADSQQTIQGLYQQALKAMGQSITMEPAYALAYFNRSQVYQQMDQLPPALTDVQQAIKLDNHETRFYREAAWVLAKMGQKSESLNMLNAYLDREPTAANSPEVQQIRNRLAQ